MAAPLWVRGYRFFAIFESEEEAQAFEACWSRSRRKAQASAFAGFFHLGWIHDHGEE